VDLHLENGGAIECHRVFALVLVLIFSGGRLEASKRSLNFQGATWHQFFSCGMRQVCGRYPLGIWKENNVEHFGKWNVCTCEHLVV